MPRTRTKKAKLVMGPSIRKPLATNLRVNQSCQWRPIWRLKPLPTELAGRH